MINRRPFWQDHLHRCQEQWMTLKAYAEQEGLTLSVFYSWSKRLKQQTTQPSSFSRVAIQPTTSTDYRLRFPNGLVLEWDGEVDTEQLSTLVVLLH